MEVCCIDWCQYLGTSLYLQKKMREERSSHALCLYCPAKSYMVLMRAGESYSTSTILSIIALSVQDPAIVAASINLMI